MIMAWFWILDLSGFGSVRIWISQDLDHSGFGFQRIPGVTYTLGTFHWIPWVTQYQGYLIQQHILSQPFMKTLAMIVWH
jgi:hypothetical protein